MTITELKAKLDSMTDEQVAKFYNTWGGHDRSRDNLVLEFVNDPRHERLLCYLLGLMTEEEKKTQAAVDSAHSARWLKTWAFLSVIISLGALGVAAFALWK